MPAPSLTLGSWVGGMFAPPRGSDSGTRGGHLVTLIASDVHKIDEAVLMMNAPWVMVFEVAVDGRPPPPLGQCRGGWERDGGGGVTPSPGLYRKVSKHYGW